MKEFAKKNILEIKPYIPGRPIEEVKRQLGLKEVIKMASNESPFGPSPKVLKTIAGAAKDINRYPDGNCFYLRRALAKKLSVDPLQLIFGNGSDEIIVMATKVFVEKGDDVIIAKPSFLIYEIASQIAGAKIKFIPLNNFQYDLEGMKKAVTGRTKIIFIGNPDNPAGTYVTARQVDAFLKGIPKRVLVFFDEAYFEFVAQKDYPDTIRLLKRYPNILVTRTFSKMYGLAGLRIGYGVARKEIVSLLDRVREPFNVNSLAQAAALAALGEGAYYRAAAKEIARGKIFLYAHLRRMKLSFIASATNFILIDVNQASFPISQALLKKGVIVRDMGVWGLKSFIRVTIGSLKENKKFIQALEEVL